MTTSTSSLYDRLDTQLNRAFDAFAEWWEGFVAQRTIAIVLIGSFFAALVLTELRRQNLLVGGWAEFIPTSHFFAIDLAFTLFLVAEVIGLIIGLATSVASSVGKQFEIFSLILLRQSFKELADFSEPISWSVLEGPVLRILSDSTGALLIFAALGLYYSMQRHRRITKDEQEQRRFVTAKKFVSLFLLVVFVSIMGSTLVDLIRGVEPLPIFDSFYTVLIFSDVLIVLISLRYSQTYHVVFRNSGFAVATVMIRLALAGPPFLNALLGLLAMIFAIGLTWSYNQFAPVLEEVPDVPEDETLRTEGEIEAG